MSDPSSPVKPERRIAYARPWALGAGLALAALAFSLALLAGRPPAPLPADAPDSEFSGGRAMALLGELLGDGRPHPVGTEANAAVRERIVTHLESLGYDVQVQETVVCTGWSATLAVCTPVQNVITRLPGQVEGPAVMVMTHYDSVGAGPGAGDCTSNVAAVLEIARILGDGGPRRNPVIFLLTDGEEEGMQGARAFAREHAWAQELGAVVNLEARGTGGASYMFETSAGNAWLIDAYAAVPQPATSSLTNEAYKVLPNDTDLSIFLERGIPGLNFAFIERPQHYHTPLDSLANLDPASVQHQGESALAVVRDLAGRDLAAHGTGDAVYMDLLGLGVIRWPAAWTLPLAVAMLLILIACAVLAMRRGAVTAGGLLLGLLAALLCAVVAVLLGAGLTWFIVRFGRGPQPWYAYPLATRLSLWAGALLGAGLAASLLGRRAGLWGLGLGAWLLWAILAIALSLTMAGAAVFLLVPGLFAALVALIALLVSPRVGAAGELATAAGAAGAAMFFLPLALVLESAVGLQMSPAITVPVGLAATALLPLFALPAPHAGLRRAAVIVSAAVLAGAALAALFVPPYSEDSPQRLNLYHVSDAGSGRAQYVSSPYAGGTPADLGEQFEGESRAALPWSNTPHLVAPAEPTGDESPTLQILSDALLDEARIVQLLLRSPRGGEAIDLWLPAARVAGITVAGEKLPVDVDSAEGRDYHLACYGLACDGLEVDLELAGPEPCTYLVADYSPGLPAAGALTPALLRAREPLAVPSDFGDRTIIWRRGEL